MNEEADDVGEEVGSVAHESLAVRLGRHFLEQPCHMTRAFEGQLQRRPRPFSTTRLLRSTRWNQLRLAAQGPVERCGVALQLRGPESSQHAAQRIEEQRRAVTVHESHAVLEKREEQKVGGVEAAHRRQPRGRRASLDVVRAARCCAQHRARVGGLELHRLVADCGGERLQAEPQRGIRRRGSCTTNGGGGGGGGVAEQREQGLVVEREASELQGAGCGDGERARENRRLRPSTGRQRGRGESRHVHVGSWPRLGLRVC